jgi:hypothetical protein
VVFWFNAAMIVRFLGSAGLLGGSSTVLTFGISIPLAAVTMGITKALVHVTWRQMTFAITLMTGIAQVLDGLAITLFPTFYGSEMENVRLGAALILFGAGAGLLLAIAAGAMWGRESRDPSGHQD